MRLKSDLFTPEDAERNTHARAAVVQLMLSVLRDYARRFARTFEFCVIDARAASDVPVSVGRHAYQLVHGWTVGATPALPLPPRART